MLLLQCRCGVVVVVVVAVVVVVVARFACCVYVVCAREKRAADTGIDSFFCRPDRCVG